MDCLTIESGKTDKDVNILVITDHISQNIHKHVSLHYKQHK